MGGIPYQTGRDIAWFFLRGSWVTGWRVKLLRDLRGHSFWDVAGVGTLSVANAAISKIRRNNNAGHKGKYCFANETIMFIPI